MQSGKWKGTVASRDRVTYWSTGVLSYFDALSPSSAPRDANGSTFNREALKDYDPGLFAIVQETMAYEGREDWRFTR
jgi:hypothetical protein